MSCTGLEFFFLVGSLVVLGENCCLSLVDPSLTFFPFWMHVCTWTCRKLKRRSPSLHQQQNVLLPLPLFPAAIALPPQESVAPGEHHHLEQPSTRLKSQLAPLTLSFPSCYPDTHGENPNVSLPGKALVIGSPPPVG